MTAFQSLELRVWASRGPGPLYWGYIGTMENDMETPIMGYIGFRVWASRGIIMEKKMEAQGPFKGIYRVIPGYIVGLYRGITEKKMETTI